MISKWFQFVNSRSGEVVFEEELVSGTSDGCWRQARFRAADLASEYGAWIKIEECTSEVVPSDANNRAWDRFRRGSQASFDSWRRVMRDRRD